MLLCHPLQLPFFEALFGPHTILDIRKNDLVIRWYYECRRKYEMGGKTGDPRWTLNALVEQYTKKIEALY
jgi:hypothetical protein